MFDLRVVLALVIGCFISLGSYAQDLTAKKGRLYVYWGYNRTLYGNSDIHLKGRGYDYTLYDVKAQDTPEEFSADVYLNPLKFTIPQFNFRVGYYLNEKYSLSIGWDHLKYVLDNNQVARIKGRIEKEALEDYSKENNINSISFVKNYNDETVFLGKDFIKYEHTDGLNYIRLGIDRHDKIAATKKENLVLSVVSSLGFGPVLPWTDFTHLSGKRYTNRLHFSGYAFSYHSGLKAEFLKRFYFQSNVGAGYVHLPWVETKVGKSDSASQKFGYAEWNFVFGFYLNPKKVYSIIKK